MNAREILNKVKAAFLGEPAPATEPVTLEPTAKVYKLQDGTEITVSQASEVVAAGDSVTVGALPAEGVYLLEDGSSLVVDATGVITEVKPIEPVTTVLETTPAPAPVITPLQASEFPQTQDQLLAIFSAFAIGTPEERIANLEKVAKALMENCFGWQLREAEQKIATDQAISIYKQGLVTAEARMAKQDEVIKGLFELAEKLIEEPTADPVTLTGNKKDQFERANKKEQRLQKIADALKTTKTGNHAYA